jgi:hypothetical protein
MASSPENSTLGRAMGGEGLHEARGRERAQTYAALYVQYPFRDERYPAEAIPRPRHVVTLHPFQVAKLVQGHMPFYCLHFVSHGSADFVLGPTATGKANGSHLVKPQSRRAASYHSQCPEVPRRKVRLSQQAPRASTRSGKASTSRISPLAQVRTLVKSYHCL